MLRACAWDHATLPYTPPTPCVLFYAVPDDPVWRVSVPNARGEYPDLVPGLPYKEWYAMEPVYLEEFAPRALRAHKSVEATWEELSPLPMEELQRFVAPWERGALR